MLEGIIEEDFDVSSVPPNGVSTDDANVDVVLSLLCKDNRAHKFVIKLIAKRESVWPLHPFQMWACPACDPCSVIRYYLQHQEVTSDTAIVTSRFAAEELLVTTN